MSAVLFLCIHSLQIKESLQEEIQNYMGPASPGQKNINFQPLPMSLVFCEIYGNYIIYHFILSHSSLKYPPVWGIFFSIFSTFAYPSCMELPLTLKGDTYLKNGRVKTDEKYGLGWEYNSTKNGVKIKKDNKSILF